MWHTSKCRVKNENQEVGGIGGKHVGQWGQVGKHVRDDKTTNMEKEGIRARTCTGHAYACTHQPINTYVWRTKARTKPTRMRSLRRYGVQAASSTSQ